MWQWLQKNTDQLTVLAAWLTFFATAAAGVIAWLYVRVTRRLATAAVKPTKVTRRLAEIAADQAAAAQQQADTTQRMFEAAYRPSVEILPTDGGFYLNHDRHNLSFHVRTHGQVPAFLTRWSISIGGDGPFVKTSPEGWRRCIFPHADHLFTIPVWGPVQGPEPRQHECPPVEAYRGVRVPEYQSRFTFRQEGRAWILVDQQLTE